MDEHLTREQIAALLDEPDAVAGGLAHLDVCSDCASEFEGMSRMRMALSGLPELPAPEGQWDRIRADLPLGSPSPARPVSVHTSGGWFGVWSRRQRTWAPALAAAAVVLLFVAGLGVGRLIAPTGPDRRAAVRSGDEAGVLADPSGPTGASEPTDAVEAANTSPADDLVAHEAEFPEYLRTVADLQELRDAGPAGAEALDDPVAAAERLARLDALIEASREAVRSAPADPALNDFLFDVVDERATLAGRLDQTIRQASMTY